MHIIVRKSKRTLEVYEGDKMMMAFEAALGSVPAGDKETEGDGKTPEGSFYVFAKNRESKYHLSLALSYPSIEDAERGLDSGLIDNAEHDEITRAIVNRKAPPQKTALGGEIYIHGGGIASDWTAGCVALENESVTELFEAVPLGTLVTIEP